MAFPQTKTPLPLTVRKRQRRINSSAVPLLLPVQSPAPRRGSSRGRPVLPCTSRQLSVTFFPGTLSRHSRIFHCHGVYSPGGLKSRDMTRLFFHLVHIMNESSSGKACPAGFAGHGSCKKGEVTVGHFTFFVCGKPCFYGAPVRPMEQTVPPIPRVVLMPTPP